MPYLFVSHHSALEALRSQGINHPKWPEERRILPVFGECISAQRTFRELERQVDLSTLGIVSRPVDVLVPTTQYRHKGKRIRTHAWRNQLPAGSFLRLHQNVLVSCPEFALLQLANVHVRKAPALDRSVELSISEREALQSLGIDEQPPVENLYEWEKDLRLIRLAQLAMEFCGTYRLPVPPQAEASYDCPQLTGVSAIQTFLDAVPPANGYKHTGGPKSLITALPWVMERSRSPFETALALMLTLPVELGGYGLPQPVLNDRLDEPGVIDLHPDFLWRVARLVVEYDSNEFHAAAGADKVDADIERANRLRAAGFTVLEATPGIVLNLQKLDAFALQVSKLLGASIPPADHGIRLRRSLLHRELFFS